MQITMEGKYQTEDGRPVEILRTGLYYDGPFNVLGIIWQGDGKCIVEAWTPDGKTTHKGIYNNDLVPVPTKHEMWAVIYADGDYRTAVADRFLFSTEAFAQGAADADNQKHPSLTHDKAHVALVTWED